MSLKDYDVEQDKFDFDEKLGGLSFPCVACFNRNKPPHIDPCKHCGHNVNAEIEVKE